MAPENAKLLKPLALLPLGTPTSEQEAFSEFFDAGADRMDLSGDRKRRGQIPGVWDYAAGDLEISSRSHRRRLLKVKVYSPNIPHNKAFELFIASRGSYGAERGTTNDMLTRLVRPTSLKPQAFSKPLRIF